MRHILVFGALLLASASARASETITYTYDTRGRLVKVAHSGTVNNGISACYAYDKADNRSNVTVNTAADCAGGIGISFSVSSNGAVTEGTNSVFTMTKTGTTAGSLTVNYATSNGTAAAPGDYTSTSGTLTFTSAQTSQAINVPTIDDAGSEAAEAFTMTLSAPSGGATLGTASATGTINDNDGGGGNQPPVANFDNGGTMSCGNEKIINVVANDTDPEGNYPLTVVSVSGPGTAVVSSTSIRLISATSGTKGFTYVVKDSLNAQATGSGSVVVTAPCQ